MTDDSRMVILGCTRSAGEAVKSLGQEGRALPRYVEFIAMPCGGSIDELHILRAFESGAERVLVLACFEGACRSVDGNRWAAKRVQAMQRLLQDIGVPAWRLQFRNMAPNMTADLVQWIEAFQEPAPAPAAEPS